MLKTVADIFADMMDSEGGVVIEAPCMSPIWLQAADYDRIRNLSEREGVSEGEVIQRALKWYDDCLSVAEKLEVIEDDKFKLMTREKE